jgi:hypothetical protein
LFDQTGKRITVHFAPKFLGRQKGRWSLIRPEAGQNPPILSRQPGWTASIGLRRGSLWGSIILGSPDFAAPTGKAAPANIATRIGRATHPTIAARIRL